MRYETLRRRAAISGIGELKPERRTEGVTTLEILARVSRLAALDAGIGPDEIDGLLVGPQVGETPQHVPATVAEYLGLSPTMSNVVDLGGASGPGMIWRAAAAIEARMCQTVLCVLGNHRDKVAARLEGGRGGANDITDIAKNGDNLVLSFEREGRGGVIDVVLTLTLDGDMINATQEFAGG